MTATATRTAADQTIATGIIAEAYEELAKYPGQFVKIRQMRELLEGKVPVLDAVLIGLYTSRVINLVSQANQQALTPADRAAAVAVAGDRKHRMSWPVRD